MDPQAIIALLTLIAMEVVLGIDNLVFIAILTNRLPEEQRLTARRIGLAMAVILRFVMLAGVGWLLSLTRPWFAVAGLEFSGKDLILLTGGLFLIAKATIEIHHQVDPDKPDEGPGVVVLATATFWPTVVQIIALDMVFSVDSILAAVGLVDEYWMIALAIVISVVVMLLSMDKLSAFMARNPSVVMLALAFLLLIGMVLVAEGVGVHLPKGFVYTAMVFSTGVESLNLLAKRAGRRRRARAAETRLAAEGQAARADG